jgi:predicted HicB family RNase H-like nuclease
MPKQAKIATGDEMLKVFTVRLPIWLHKKLKVKAAQDDRKLQDVVFEKLREYVEGK